MLTSEKKKQLRIAFGYPLTTKRQVRDAMGYKQYNEVRHYFYGLGQYGSKYFTDEVIERIMGEVKYEEEECF